VAREELLATLAAFHAAQGAFYAGGSAEPLRALLAADVEWHVPGSSVIAGDYAGRDATMAYFATRRDLAQETFRMHPGEVLTGDGPHAAVLTDGEAWVDGVHHRWSTVGLYRIAGGRVAACWLLPLDGAAFDAAWGRT
jgi:uncharacterized protein